MAKDITIYPVDNGQSALLTLDDETHILFDLRQIPKTPEKGERRTNVHAELLRVLPKTKAGNIMCIRHR